MSCVIPVRFVSMSGTQLSADEASAETVVCGTRGSAGHSSVCARVHPISLVSLQRFRGPCQVDRLLDGCDFGRYKLHAEIFSAQRCSGLLI